MPVAIDPRKRVPFVLEDERPLPVPPGASEEDQARIAEENRKRAEKAVTFHLGILTAYEWSRCLDDREDPGTLDLRLLRGGLRPWHWANGPKYGVADVDRGTPTDETIACLLPRHRVELAAAIRDLNLFGDLDAGKS